MFITVERDARYRLGDRLLLTDMFSKVDAMLSHAASSKQARRDRVEVCILDLGQVARRLSGWGQETRHTPY